MSDDEMTPGFKGLLDLINAPNKREAQKICRDLIVESQDLFELIIAGRHGLLQPYRYACHFSDYTPEHVIPTQEQMSALSQYGPGEFTGKAKTAVNKLFQTFKDRRMFAAHLFYLPEQDYWSLFYFDQRDRSEFDNHWKIGGPHIHYACEAFTRDPMQMMWQKVCQLPPNPPGASHVRYRETQDEG
ncbi:hypothetical protein ACVCL0_06695 [Rhodanobacter sp. UC4450_H17]